MNYKLAPKYVNLFLLIDLRVKKSDEFEKSTENVAPTLDALGESNSDLIVALGDLNKKSKNWYNNDKTTTEGAKIEFVTSQFGLHQIINDSTRFTEFLTLY